MRLWQLSVIASQGFVWNGSFLCKFFIIHEISLNCVGISTIKVMQLKWICQFLWRMQILQFLYPSFKIFTAFVDRITETIIQANMPLFTRLVETSGDQYNQLANIVFYECVVFWKCVVEVSPWGKRPCCSPDRNRFSLLKWPFQRLFGIFSQEIRRI